MGMHVSWVGNQLQPNTDIAKMRKQFAKYLRDKQNKNVPSKYILVSQMVPFYTAKSEDSYKALQAEASGANPPTLYLGHFEKSNGQLKLKKWKECTPGDWEKLFQQNSSASDSRYFLRISSFNDWQDPETKTAP